MAAKLTYNLEETPLGTVVPPGKYLAKIITIEESTSKGGNLMLIWTWQITQGTHSGNTITSYTSLRENSDHFLKRYLKALGYKGAVNLDIKDLIGKRALLTVDKRVVSNESTGDTKEYPRVSEVSPPGKLNQPSDDE